MSEVKVNKISPRSGTDVTLGDSGDTFTIPSGATLTNSGTATGFAAIAWQSVVTASTLTAVAGRGYPINTTSNACTVTLPASASVGDQIIFTDYARQWATNNLTINPNSLNYQGNSSPNPVYDTDGESIHIVYMDVTKGWIPTYDGAVVLETPQEYSAEYLVIAGGASGGTGDDRGGGGGGGGYLTNYGGSAVTLTGGSAYTVTVGAGGAAVGGGGSKSQGNPGVDGSFSGSGISTITCTGGGYGGGGNYDSGIGGDGGSGGGGASTSGSGSGAVGGSGTSPQGYDGGDGSNTGPEYGSAGGGGASAVGQDGSSSSGGDGGDGVASSITGASVTRTGGGGGATDSNTNLGQGGSGGGGVGGDTVGSGTVNTGSGGGGCREATPVKVSGAGGSGVVILRFLTADYSGSTTGSPTVSTDGLDTILTFTGDGTYTA